MKILVVNAGSSSQKWKLYELALDAKVAQTLDRPLWEANLAWSEHEGSVEVEIQTGTTVRPKDTFPSAQRKQLFHSLLASLTSGPAPVLGHLADITVVGHRVVHGGLKLTAPIVIDETVLAQIEACIPLAPEHQPVALEMIHLMCKALPEAVQVAAFDTAFHATMPRAARIYPGPYSWFEQGWQRFGFHGLSYQYLTVRVPQVLGPGRTWSRMVACHIGNGASVAAILDAHSVDTSMGFTPLEGLMMGSRSGSIDPGLLFYILRSGVSIDGLEQTLQEHSGLVGLSGISNDVREIIAGQEAGNDRACIALEVYVHRLVAGISAMTGSLNGLDVIAFTGGVGEHSEYIREQVCQKLAYLGLRVDREKNELASGGDRDIADAASTVPILVVEAQEDLMIAYSARDVGRAGH